MGCLGGFIDCFCVIVLLVGDFDVDVVIGDWMVEMVRFVLFFYY